MGSTGVGPDPAGAWKGTAMMPHAIVAALFMTVLATSALAATWCVPHEEIGGACQKVSPTIQGAIDRGAPGDTIRVGPGNPAERITITKRVRMIGLPGHRITDAGLDHGGVLLSFAGDIASPVFLRLELDVVTSSAGIVVPSTVTNAQFKGVRVTSTARPRPALRLPGQPERADVLHRGHRRDPARLGLRGGHRAERRHLARPRSVPRPLRHREHAELGALLRPGDRRPVLAAGPGARPAERKKLVIEMQKRVLENAYFTTGLWWTRNVVHRAKVKNYVAPPSHYTNQKLEDVWLAED